MDPNECLDQLIDAAVKGRSSELLDYAENLADWLEKGGFAPRDPREMEATR